jgi:ring-1,2-phenylacetyl-CoA epoxidase subunit PaaE
MHIPSLGTSDANAKPTRPLWRRSSAQRMLACQAHFNAVIDVHGDMALTVALDGKPHNLRMNKGERVLDVALSDWLDLPWSCCDGVCCTCHTKVMKGSVQMDKNFTLEPWETDKGFVLRCQARPTSDTLMASHGEG